MRPQPNVAEAADISGVLKDLDRRLCAAWPARVEAGAKSAFLDRQGQLIAETLGDAGIQNLTHAVFHEFSNAPAHREAARRWFGAHSREAKKARFVYDRFDALARLKRLGEAMSDDEPVAIPAPAPAPVEDTRMLLTQQGLQLLFSAPNVHGTFAPEIVEEVRRLRQNRPYLLLAFPPKCGGTFIRDVVGRLSGAGPNPVRLGHALGGRDVSPYLPLLALQLMSLTGPKAFLAHMHMVGHYSNIQILNLFGLKPVVMKRSIPDMLCSFADMVLTEGVDSNGSYNWSILCGVHTDASFLLLSDEARLDFFLLHQAPWYIQFYASWLRADRNKLLPVHWTSYDAFRANESATISGILRFYGLHDKVAGVAETLAQAKANQAGLRFNKGVSGRGAALLKSHHMRHLHLLAAGYPDIDFVAEGLLPPL